MVNVPSLSFYEVLKMKIPARLIGKLFVGFLVLSLATPLPAFARSGPQGFADLAEKLLPAVVNISTTQTITTKDGDDLPDLQLPPGSPFEDFFKDFMQKQHGQDAPRKHKATALGSGFIIDPSGIIVTNYHVIDGADTISVILQDGTNLSATVVGRDKKTDLAVLKVTPKKPLTAVAFGDSDKVRVGDWILAIGNPYGLGGTVTAGIISARARDIQSGPYDEYLQTDAPINRGNSGGPMFDMDGNVVGVNTAIYSPSGGSIGIGFAIPSALAKNIVDQLKTSGHIKRGWLGVRIQNVTQDIADSLGLGQARGALVSSVSPDGPAAKAGVLAGDVIIGFDGKDVPDMHRLPLMVAETDVNKTVDLVVFRKGKNVTLKVKIGELTAKESADEDEGQTENAPSAIPGAEKVEELGLTAAPVTDPLRSRYDIRKGVAGVVVTSVSEGSVAADQGIQTGDVVTEAAQQEVKTPKELSERAKQAKTAGKPLLLLINRKDDLQYVAITLGKKK
ncbi:MAG: DegQ family serine endoprotease [Alphaproteobacteria bacterium]|nr:DegQ family serine endoprotease [Alphaproteobacteria bacterium]